MNTSNFQEVKKLIEAKYQSQLVFAKNDVLVHLEFEKQFEVEILDESFEFGQTEKLIFDKELVQSYIKHANANLKNHGVNTLCLVCGTQSWTYENDLVNSPLLLVPLQIKATNHNPNVSFYLDWEQCFINPFLKNEFEDFSELELPKTKNDFIIFLNKISQTLNTAAITNHFFISNAHPDRFDRLRDLRLLSQEQSFSPAVETLFGFNSKDDLEQLKGVESIVLPADPSQNAALQLIQHSNTVLIGPPGTGKSQVLVNAIAQSLVKNERVLICSEKIAALHVIQKRLTELGLSSFSHVFEAFNTNSTFIKSLQNTWYFLENLPFNNKTDFQYSTTLCNQLQSTLDQLQHPTFAMGVSYQEYLEATKSCVSEKTDAIAPLLDQWNREKNSIKKLYNLNIANDLAQIPAAILNQSNHYQNSILELQKRIDSFENTPDLKHVNWKQLEDKARLSSLCVHFLGHEIALEKSIFEVNSKMNKRFLTLRKKSKKIEILKQQNASEIENYISNETQLNQLLAYSSAKSLRKLLLESKLIKRLGSKERIKEGLASISNRNDLQQQQTAIDLGFLELGIESKVDMESAYFFLNMLQNDPNRAQFFELTLAEKKQLSGHGMFLGRLISDLKPFIKPNQTQEIFRTLQSAKAALVKIVLNSISIDSISSESIQLMEKCHTFNEFEQVVLVSNKQKFESLFPHLTNWNTVSRNNKIQQILQSQKTEFKNFSNTLIQLQRSNFFKYNALLSTPTAQLNVDDKKIKQNLRKGKAILVHEFSKKKSHLSLKALLNSEAAIWINILKPVLLGNPSHLAQQIPLHKMDFDLGCIDEASQMLFAHALPIAQRCKKLLIAGDPQQMTPSFFFQKGVNEVDVLHQAYHYFQRSQLKYHYRSEHPTLLEFSNHFFYKNELIPVKKMKPTSPITLHYCENGVFEHRKNESEATLISELILKNKSKESIGLVAFSETQLSCILDALITKNSTVFDEESTRNFALSLEQVQGSECDHLYISVGYAKNKEGTLKLAFGTLNLQAGARRLNVLFSRAKKSITLVHSIKHDELNISKNEGVNMLRWYLKRYETSENRPILNNRVLDENNVDELLLQFLE